MVLNLYKIIQYAKQMSTKKCENINSIDFTKHGKIYLKIYRYIYIFILYIFAYLCMYVYLYTNI